MATNGESAALWLKDNALTLTAERVRQVYDNIQGKLNSLPVDDTEAPGLLDALEVLDNYLTQGFKVGAEPALTKAINATANKPLITEPALPQLDTSSLTPEIEPCDPLNDDEKQRRFTQLLQKSHFKRS